MVLQAIFIWKTTQTAQDFIDKMSAISKDLEAESREVLGQLETFNESLGSLRRIVDDAGGKAEEINVMFDARARQVDQLVEKLVTVGSKQADKVDEVVTDTVTKFEETTGIIQEDILRPLVEISSLVKGFRTGFDYLFAGKRKDSSSEKYPEDELFI
jgi:methyl-accepting chemotaxis protein